MITLSPDLTAMCLTNQLFNPMAAMPMTPTGYNILVEQLMSYVKDTEHMTMQPGSSNS